LGGNTTGSPNSQPHVAAFDELLQRVEHELLRAQEHFDNWEAIFPTQQVIDVLNRYVGFFRPTIDAHIAQFFIKVANVTGTDQRLPSLYRLFKMIEEHADLAPNVNIKTLRSRLKAQRQLLERVRKFRDTRIAHFDTTIKPDAVLFGESRSLLQELEDVFNEIRIAHKGRRKAFDWWGQQHDAKELLCTLEEAHAQRSKDL